MEIDFPVIFGHSKNLQNYMRDYEPNVKGDKEKLIESILNNTLTAFRSDFKKWDHDKDVTLALVNKNKCAINYVSNIWRNDKDISLQAIKTYYGNIEVVSSCLQRSPECIAAMIRGCLEEVKHNHERMAKEFIKPELVGEIGEELRKNGTLPFYRKELLDLFHEIFSEDVYLTSVEALPKKGSAAYGPADIHFP